jgi:hypothetical protein
VLPDASSAYAYPGYRPDAAGGASSATGSYRTLCVRLCDGFYFPISFATPEAGLARDAEQCRASCGAEARLFYHLNPGGSVETMLDLTGRAYSALPNAFKYRKTLISGCHCRPQAGSGTAADDRGQTAGTLELPMPEAIDPLTDADAPRALERPTPIVRDLDHPPQGRPSSWRARAPIRAGAPDVER